MTKQGMSQEKDRQRDREVRIPETEPVEIPEDWQLGGDEITVPDTYGPNVSASDDQEAWATLARVAQEDPLLRAVLDAVTVLRNIGGVVAIAAVREELAPQIYRTVEYAWRWNPYAPARKPEPEPVEQPEPEPVTA